MRSKVARIDSAERRRDERSGMERSRLGQMMLPGAVVLVVAVMVIPLPSQMLDLLIVASLSTAILILLVSMNVRRALDFSSFPSLLLVVTLFRLGLNVATSRAVLSTGHAGKVIETFGSVVVGGSLIVGMVIFLILTLVQFVVISNGSGRVAEVTARFTLDAMPGKQMAIDADLSAGAITDEQARHRRKEVGDEADFYGAMDGASKFVKGDAIAGLVITMVNLIGGFLIGVVQLGMPVDEAIEKYSLLTIGDGLVSQIPALLVSISAGLIVTRSAGGSDLGQRRVRPVPSPAPGDAGCRHRRADDGPDPRVCRRSRSSCSVWGCCWCPTSCRAEVDLEIEDTPLVPVDDVAPPSPQQMAVDSRVEPLELNIAYDLIGLVDGGSGGDLLDRVGALRRKLASELGFVMPSIRTRDARRPAVEHLRHPRARGRGRAWHGAERQGARDRRSPRFVPGRTHSRTRVRPGGPLGAGRVPGAGRDERPHRGRPVDAGGHPPRRDRPSPRRPPAEPHRREDPDRRREGDRPAGGRRPEHRSASRRGEVQRVLGGLLDDGVPIRDLVRILEAVGDRARTSRTVESMVEAARAELGPAITTALATDGRLTAVTLAASTEHRLLGGLRTIDGISQLELLPDDADHLVRTLTELVGASAMHGTSPVLVCSAPLRSALGRLVKATVPGIAVVNYGEIGDHLQIDVIANIDLSSPTGSAANQPTSTFGGSEPEEHLDAYAVHN